MFVAATAAACFALTFALGDASAIAQDDGTAGSAPGQVMVPSTLPDTPDSFEVGASEAIEIANREPVIEEVREEHGEVEATPEAKPRRRWEVAYRSEGEGVALVVVDAESGEVLDAWTGDQVDWPMARGYEEQFGHVLNAPYVWIPLALAFFFGLFDFRRPRRLAHLDLLVLLSFGISHVFFNEAEIGVSVPLAYPPLLYLLARAAWIGFRGAGTGLLPSAPFVWLAVALAFLVGFRVAINIADSGVIDVGYAGVIGADNLTHGEPLYGDGAFPPDNPTGDTYGPANYLVYVPFELAMPWSGDWDELPAAHAAAIVFDLATIVGLFFFGGRLRRGPRGRKLGVILAFAWAAYPYTAFAIQSNSNDSLVAALLVWALVAFNSIGTRALLLAVAGLAKFVPLALVPLFATGQEGLAGRLRPALLPRRTLAGIARFLAVFAVATACMLVYPAIEPGLATAWERTLGKQLDRDSPFSIWGQVPDLEALRALPTVAVGAFALSLAFVPKRRSLVQVAALSAAVLIAVQLTLAHWFYLYIPWFLGAFLAAIAVGRDAEEPGRPAE